LGIIYLSDFNEKVINKLLKENHLEFHPLFKADPHVFVSSAHPLSNKKKVALEDLDTYPFLAFEQGEYNSFYFSEEILSTVPHKKTIHVSDRATLFNLLIGLNGYTICTGVLSRDLNGDTLFPCHWIRMSGCAWAGLPMKRLNLIWLQRIMLRNSNG
jgi:DNA-binding transcriptional LysR family regulator